jgi:nucleoid-associated protein YgaU
MVPTKAASGTAAHRSCGLGRGSHGSPAWHRPAQAQTSRSRPGAALHGPAGRGQAGVPLSELAPNAPDSYTVKSGDTLWAISGLFLKRPWRWPELWGMNLEEVRNPHRIYPGQVLYLEKANGRARLRIGQPRQAPCRPKPSACRRAPASTSLADTPCRRCRRT